MKQTGAGGRGADAGVRLGVAKYSLWEKSLRERKKSVSWEQPQRTDEGEELNRIERTSRMSSPGRSHLILMVRSPS